MRRHRRGRALKRRYGRSKIPLKVLEHRLHALQRVVRARGGR